MVLWGLGLRFKSESKGEGVTAEGTLTHLALSLEVSLLYLWIHIKTTPTSIAFSFHFNSLLVFSLSLFLSSSHALLGDTPFEDGTFKLMLQFDETYPNKPPTVKFMSKMFHPNVYANGELCLDILQNRWSPTYDVAAILTSIQSLLHDPNPNSPANAEAANLYRENRKEYTRRVREIVEASWESDS